MKIFRIIMLVILSIVDVYLIYSTIGYAIIGVQDYPNIIGLDGVKNTTFTGMYIMSITFGIVALIITSVIISIIVKLVKSRKKY